VVLGMCSCVWRKACVCACACLRGTPGVAAGRVVLHVLGAEVPHLPVGIAVGDHVKGPLLLVAVRAHTRPTGINKPVPVTARTRTGVSLSFLLSFLLSTDLSK
jgi:hypothetical protein